MSHFTSMTVDFKQSSEQELIEALESVFGKGTVEVHPEGSALYGFQGDNRANRAVGSSDYAPPCHLIIRRRNVGSASNDVGFRRNENGTYDAYVSDYDKGGNYSSAKQAKVAQEYALKVSEKQLKKAGYTTKRVVKTGGVVQIVGSRYTN